MRWVRFSSLWSQGKAVHLLRTVGPLVKASLNLHSGDCLQLSPAIHPRKPLLFLEAPLVFDQHSQTQLVKSLPYSADTEQNTYYVTQGQLRSTEHVFR